MKTKYHELPPKSAVKFKPLDYVKVTLYGLNFHGRVIRVIWEHPMTVMYDVDYVCEGQLKRREFYGDELEAI